MDVAPLELARLDLGLTIFDLWLAYFALGGIRNAAELGTYLTDGGRSSEADHDAVVHALNEAYGDRGQDHPLAYSHV